MQNNFVLEGSWNINQSEKKGEENHINLETARLMHFQ